MKEAAGEANMTVITIILIGVVAAAAGIFIPNFLNQVEIRGCCVSDGGKWNNGACSNGQTYSKNCSKVK